MRKNIDFNHQIWSVEFLLSLDKKNTKKLIDVLSQYYPLSENILRKYAYVWNWTRLSGNGVISWNKNIINDFLPKWDWDGFGLSGNPSLPLTQSFIEEFKDHWNWHTLSRNENVPWSEELILTFKHKWIWDYLIEQPLIANNPTLLSLCHTCWEEWGEQATLINKRDGSNFYAMASHRNVSKSFILKYRKEWFKYDWEKICENYINSPYWDADFIDALKEYWNWKTLSYNQSLPWTEELVERFKDKWFWPAISWNRVLNWNEEFINKFQSYVDWKTLGRNKSVPWTWDMINQYADKIRWTEAYYDKLASDFYIPGLYQNPNIIWTVERFKKYKSDIHKEISDFLKSINFNYKDYFEDYEYPINEHYERYWIYWHNTNNWSYELLQYILQGKDEDCSAKDLNWEYISEFGIYFWKNDFVEKYQNKFNYRLLIKNKHFPWNKYLNKIAPHLNEDNWIQLIEGEIFKINFKEGEKLQWTNETIKLLINTCSWENIYSYIRNKFLFIKHFAHFWDSEIKLEKQEQFKAILEDPLLHDHFPQYLPQQVLQQYLEKTTNKDFVIYDDIIKAKTIIENASKNNTSYKVLAELKVTLTHTTWDFDQQAYIYHAVCTLIKGKFNITNKVRIIRKNTTIYIGELKSLTQDNAKNILRGKFDITEMPSKDEPSKNSCTITVKDYIEIRVDDIIEIIEIKENKAI